MLNCKYNKLKLQNLKIKNFGDNNTPYHDGSATGIAFANPLTYDTVKGKSLSPSLRIIKDAVSRTIYNGQDFDFDPTLINWAKQGVLLLNTALTVDGGSPTSHKHLWVDFTQRVLQKLSEVNSGIIYCLWGKYADSYSMYINSNSNTILRCNHPAYSVYQGIPWECDHFVMINTYLKNFNNITIEW
jgi:uracil-DNA glycosylase